MENKIKITGDSWAALNMELSNLIMHHAYHNEKLNTSLPSIETIYHYASLPGLISIIENQSLFCTNINF